MTPPACHRVFRGKFELSKIIWKHVSFGKAGLKKSAVRLSRISRFSCRANNFSISLAPRAKAQANQLPTRLKNKTQTKTLPGQAKFESCFSERQARIHHTRWSFTTFKLLLTPLDNSRLQALCQQNVGKQSAAYWVTFTTHFC